MVDDDLIKIIIIGQAMAMGLTQYIQYIHTHTTTNILCI